MLLQRQWRSPFVLTETLRACALIGPHLVTAGGESGSSSSCGVFSPELGGIPGLGGARYPLWKDDVSCSASGRTSGVYEHNSECRAVTVIGQDWSSEVVALFLEDWELGRVALCCHMAMDLLCREMRDACRDRRVAGLSLFTVFAVVGRFSRKRVGGARAWKVNCHSKRKPFTHHGRGVNERSGVW